MTLKDLLDAVSTLGALGFALLAVYALISERVVPAGRLRDAEARIAEEKLDKKEAIQLARDAVADNERLADAIEARNRLEEARIVAEREARQR